MGEDYPYYEHSNKPNSEGDISPHLDELSKLIIENLSLYPEGVKSRHALWDRMRKKYGINIVPQKNPFNKRIDKLIDMGIIVEISDKNEAYEKKLEKIYKKNIGGGRGRPIKLNSNMEGIKYTVYGRLKLFINTYLNLFEEYIKTNSPHLDDEDIIKAKELIFAELEQLQNWIMTESYPESFKKTLLSFLSPYKEISIELPYSFKKELVYDIFQVKYKIESLAYDVQSRSIPPEFLQLLHPLDYIERRKLKITLEIMDILLARFEDSQDVIKRRITYSKVNSNPQSLTKEQINKIKENLEKIINQPKKEENCMSPEEFATLMMDAVDYYVKADFKRYKKIYDELTLLKKNFEIYKVINLEFPDTFLTILR